MKVTRKNPTSEINLREVRCGEIFEFDNALYIKIYEADIETYCDNCGDCVTLDTNDCYGVDLKDGGLYAFNPCEKVKRVNCEVVEK